MLVSYYRARRYHDFILPSDVVEGLKTGNSLSAFNLNVRSLKNKMDAQDTLVSHFQPHFNIVSFI